MKRITGNTLVILASVALLSSCNTTRTNDISTTSKKASSQSDVSIDTTLTLKNAVSLSEHFISMTYVSENNPFKPAQMPFS